MTQFGFYIFIPIKGGGLYDDVGMMVCKDDAICCERRDCSPMTEKTTQSVANLGYHAHIYYDPTSTRAVAERVCAALGEKFTIEVDGFRDTPIGTPDCQCAGRLQARPVRACCAVSDAEPPRARRAGPSADRGRGRSAALTRLPPD
jgi:hypothetical protein